MTNSICCRGAASEIATLFDAEWARGLDWTPDIWPGEPALIVIAGGGRKRLRTSVWGLAETALTSRRTLAGRGTVFAREIAGTGDGLLVTTNLARCLIVIESFAYPHGDPGRRCRAWGCQPPRREPLSGADC